jgi:hypothetical protein
MLTPSRHPLALVFVLAALPLALQAAESPRSTSGERGVSGGALLQTGQPAAAAARPLPTSRCALVIGVERFSGYRELKPLTAAPQAANEFEQFLRTQWGLKPDSIVLMTERSENAGLRPTHDNIVREADRLAQRCGPGTQVIVFYAGRAANVAAGEEDWLAPSDANRSQLEKTFLSVRRLTGQLEAKRPASVIFFVDAGRDLAVDSPSAIGPRKTQSRPDSFADSWFLASAREGEGAVEQPAETREARVFACREGQQSRLGRKEHFEGSVFTHFLLEALYGDPQAADADGVITAASLEGYLEPRVRSYAEKILKEMQQPRVLALDKSSVMVGRAFDPRPQSRGDAQSAEDKAREAESRRELGKLQEAEALANEAIRLDPGNSQAHYVLGRLLDDKVQRLRVLRELQDALRFNVDQVAAQERLETRLESMLEGRPRDAAELAKQAKTELEAGRLDDAETSARLAVAVYASNALAHAVLGKVWETRRDRAGSPAEAADARAAAIREYQQAVRLLAAVEYARPRLEALRQATPADPLVQANRALLALNESRLREAEDLAREALLAQDASAKAHFVLGSVLRQRQVFDEARLELSLTKRYDPSFPQVDTELRLVDEQAPLWEHAREAYRSAKIGQLAKAESEANQVRSEAPGNPYLPFIDAIINEKRGRVAEVGSSIGQSQQPIPDNIRRQPLAAGPSPDQLALDAYSAKEQGRWEEAERKAAEALSRDATSARAHLVLAAVREHEKRYPEAIDRYRLAARQAKQFPPAQEITRIMQEATEGQSRVERLQAQIEAKLDAEAAYKNLLRYNYLEARQLAQRAVDRDRSNPDAFAVLGIVQMNSDPIAGKESVRQALALDSDNPLGHLGQGLSIHLQADEARLSGFDLDAQARSEREAAQKSQKLADDARARPQEARKFRDEAAAHLKEADQRRARAEERLREARQLYDQAALEYRRVLARSADNALAHSDLGAVYMGLADVAELLGARDARSEKTRALELAQQELTEALKGETQLIFARFNLAVLYLQQSQQRDGEGRLQALAEAERRLQALVTLDEQVPRFHAYLAWALGDQEQEAAKRNDRQLAQQKREQRRLHAQIARDREFKEWPLDDLLK